MPITFPDLHTISLSAVNFYNYFITGYFICINTIYIMMLFIAFFAITKHLHHIQSVELNRVFQSPFAKPVSILVPAYNEEATIVTSLQSILQLQYPIFEIVLINDGSNDQTLRRLIKSFALRESKTVIRRQLQCENIKGLYKSKTYANLVVIDKENGGKADALNAGINASKYPLICTIDADSVLEPDVLLKVVRPFIEDKSTVAAGGSVRIGNGCEINNGRVVKIGLPKSLLGKFQVMEYIRAFLAGRVAFSSTNSLLIISGAFGIFKKDKVIQAGGYLTDTIGEDMELVVRLHAKLKENKEKYRITFIPDPVCWTEAPEKLGILSKQRKRWQRGLLESLLHHKRMMLNPRYGIIGLMSYPFFLLVEGLGPLIEFTGIGFFLLALYYDLVSYELALLFFVAAIVLNIVLSIGAVIFEEMTFRRYPKLSHIFILCSLSLIETFIYRPITAWWRLVGVFQYFAGIKGQWGKMERKGL